MSVFCPNCSKQTYNEYNCDFCQFEIKKKNNLNKQKNMNKNIVWLKDNPLISGAILFIIFIIVYFIVQDYLDRQVAREFVHQMGEGTRDITESYNKLLNNLF